MARLSFLGNSRSFPADGAREELAEIRLETSYWIKQKPGDLNDPAAAALWLSTPEHNAQVLTIADDTGNRPRRTARSLALFGDPRGSSFMGHMVLFIPQSESPFLTTQFVFLALPPAPTPTLRENWELGAGEGSTGGGIVTQDVLKHYREVPSVST